MLHSSTNSYFNLMLWCWNQIVVNPVVVVIRSLHTAAVALAAAGEAVFNHPLNSDLRADQRSTGPNPRRRSSTMSNLEMIDLGNYDEAQVHTYVREQFSKPMEGTE